MASATYLDAVYCANVYSFGDACSFPQSGGASSGIPSHQMGSIYDERRSISTSHLNDKESKKRKEREEKEKKRKE